MRTTQVEKRSVTVEREVVVSDVVTCDICGRPTTLESPVDYDEEVNWVAESGVYQEIDATRVARTEGYTAPDGGAKTMTAVHICPDCFPRLIEWVASFRGATPTVTTSDR